MRQALSGRTNGARRRVRSGAGAALAALALLALLAACSENGAPAQPVGDAIPVSTDSGPAPDALAVTATIGQDQLPLGKPGLGKPPVVVGSKDFSEQTLLGQLYAQALVAKGYTVTTRANIGSSEVIDTSLSSGQIQMYPEYLGVLVTSVALQPGPISASDTYKKAKEFEERQRGATILKQTPFQNKDAVAVTTQVAQQYNLNTISDINIITPGGAGGKIAGQQAFSTRQTGLLGLQQQYNLPKLGFISAKPGDQYDVLDSGAVQMVDAFTTDAALQSGKYKLLTDPKNIFGFQYVAPVIDQGVLAQQGPEFAATCNWVSSLLTTETIQSLNGQVESNDGDAASIAQQFLTVNGLQLTT